MMSPLCRSVLSMFVLLALSAEVVGCEDDHGEPSIVRAAPPVVVDVDQTVVSEVRGCAFEGSRHLIGSHSGGVLTVWAASSSDSSGTMALSLPFGDRDVEENTQVVDVLVGRTVQLQEDHAVDAFDVVIAGSSSDREDRCTEWNPIEFTWTDVSGADPLRVDWEVGFALEIEQSIEVGVDFRTYD